MRERFARLIVICWCALLLTQFAAAQDSEWKGLNQEARSLHEQGNYDRAIVVAKKALEVAEREFDPEHPNVATALNNLALFYYAQGQYAAAEPLYKRSLAIKEGAFGPDDHDDKPAGRHEKPELLRDARGYGRHDALQLGENVGFVPQRHVA